MKIIIAGGRALKDLDFLREKCDHLLQNVQITEIVSGKASGTDTLGEQYAAEKGYAVKEFPADWKQHGKSAGYVRNEQMAEYADGLIAFWDGESKGTKHMIDLAHKYKLKVKIVKTLK